MMFGENIVLKKFIRIFNKCETVFAENSNGNEMFIVCSGRVKLFTESQGGRRTVLAVLKPGDHFGEMALVDRSARSATAVAIKDNTKLVVLDKPKFLYLVQQQPDFALAIMETLCMRLRDTNAHLARVEAERPQTRRRLVQREKADGR
jgi:CRP/FNR family transcriptional regulator, cyclic AMP receptor protein